MHSINTGIQNINTSIDQLKDTIPILLKLVGFTWCIHIANILSQDRLNMIGGIIPRHLFGMQGIICSPFLHASISHILVNSLFFLILGSMVLIHGENVFINASISIVLISGTLTWIIGRPAIHIGASGVIMGYWGYLIVSLYYQPDIITLASVIIGGYHFGASFFEGLLPTSSTTSWEGHLSGIIAGGLTTYYYNDITIIISVIQQNLPSI